MRREFFCAAIAAALLAVVGCGQAPSGVDASAAPPLTVGMELTYPPFEMVDEKGVPAGVGVALAQGIAASLGRELQIENIAFDGLIVALKAGQVDMVVSSMTATDVRRQSIDFSDPYVKTGLSILVPKNSVVSGIADLGKKGQRIAVKLGTTGQTYAEAHLSEADIVVLDEDIACVLEVSQGKADAFIYDQLSIYRHHKKHSETTRAILEAFQKEEWAVGLRKGDTNLKEGVNAFLQQFQSAGGFNRLAEKYLADEKKMLEAQGVPFVF